MTIKEVHPQYAKHAKRWEKNRDFCEGEQAVKGKGRDYLPDDNEEYVNGIPQGKSVKDDKDPYKYERKYQNLLKRASFMSFSQHTLNGWTGLVFNEDPTYDLKGIEYIEANVDGSGQSLEQLAKVSVSESCEVGRYAYLVDMPAAKPNQSKADEEKANAQPRVLSYTAESILDWDTTTIGSLTFLSYVKLREADYEVTDDDNGISRTYDTDIKYNYRVLRIDDEGYYTNALYDEEDELLDYAEPTKAGGIRLDRIPFYFIGSENNQPDVDSSPISGVVDLNAAHYRNSADNEELLHLYSLPTPHLDVGANETTQNFKENNPRGVIAGLGLLTQGGGTFTLEQIQANSAIGDAMLAKVEAAEKIGALTSGEGKSQNVTAEAARINAASTTANLTTVVGNVSEALTDALKMVAEFKGVDSAPIFYELSSSFYGETIDTEKLQWLDDMYDKGRFSAETYKKLSEKFGLVLDGDEFVEEDKPLN